MHMIDTIRALFTYSTALLIVIGGGVILVLIRNDTGNQDLIAIVAGFMGASISFLFQQETATRTARQTASAHQTGAISHANGLAGTHPASGAGGD